MEASGDLIHSTYSHTYSNIRYTTLPFCACGRYRGVVWGSFGEYIILFCLSIDTRSIEGTEFSDDETDDLLYSMEGILYRG